MQDSVIVTLGPFCLEQQVTILKDNQIQEKLPIRMSQLKEELPLICKDYNINKICIKGIEPYAEKVKNDLINNKFNNEAIIVEII